MIVVISCAGSKNTSHGSGYLRTKDGKKVCFVANPELLQLKQLKPSLIYACPDDLSDQEIPWRQVLKEYNEAPNGNPLGLLSAIELYKPKIYGDIVNKYNPKNVYILSAGWGLVRSDFLLPYYNITFSKAGDVAPFSRGAINNDSFKDFCMLPNDPQNLVFFGGKKYIPLFCRLTADYRGKRVIYYNANSPPNAPNCLILKYETNIRTNWHYKCASDFISGGLPDPFQNSRT